jgi:hypothetical protein
MIRFATLFLVARLAPFQLSAVVEVLFGHIRSFLLLFVCAVLVYLDILEQPIDDIDNLHHIIRDVLFIQFLFQ